MTSPSFSRARKESIAGGLLYSFLFLWPSVCNRRDCLVDHLAWFRIIRPPPSSALTLRPHNATTRSKLQPTTVLSHFTKSPHSLSKVVSVSHELDSGFCGLKGLDDHTAKSGRNSCLENGSLLGAQCSTWWTSHAGACTTKLGLDRRLTYTRLDKIPRASVQTVAGASAPAIELAFLCFGLRRASRVLGLRDGIKHRLAT